MTSIRIAIAAALVLAAAFAGGAAHVRHAATPATIRTVAFVAPKTASSPPLCC
jgi:hypothetical protein